MRGGLLAGAIVTLDGFGLDDDGCVAMLPCLGAGSDRPCDVAGGEGEREDCEGCKDGQIVA